MNPNQNPLAGYCPTLLDEYDNLTAIGRTLRAIDAAAYCQQLVSLEADCAAEESHINEIDERLERVKAMSRFNTNYLLATGVHPHERHQMKSIVESIAKTGRHTLIEAARLLNETDPLMYPTVADLRRQPDRPAVRNAVLRPPVVLHEQ